MKTFFCVQPALALATGGVGGARIPSPMVAVKQKMGFGEIFLAVDPRGETIVLIEQITKHNTAFNK